MENRIKRLVYEEQRAKNLTDIANEKAEKLLKARDRHQKELEDLQAEHDQALRRAENKARGLEDDIADMKMEA